ncbi:hypothetical protein AMECASPLE_022672 [Ameca splendens]|uniref:Auxin response factor n=1 Tax=Ameca splendens TaxID=208324 RepID=A0ABV0ZZG0_9TELE
MSLISNSIGVKKWHHREGVGVGEGFDHPSATPKMCGQIPQHLKTFVRSCPGIPILVEEVPFTARTSTHFQQGNILWLQRGEAALTETQRPVTGIA